ncbi:MAG: TraR/DksA C4-type zinc finger protein [Armatimonadetes bacterium]|nr:TraR/DksA C4-type zinc finger protein [Armatimonadota bacterium]
MAEGLDVDQYRRLLREERDRLQGESDFVDNTGNEDASSDRGELADYDTNHPADMATETFDRTRKMALETNDEDILSQVNQALQKIEDGTYGSCDRCGAAIPVERLDILPYATFCIRCQDILEGSVASRPLPDPR